MDEPRCYWCEYAERGDPCRREGVRDYARMARAYAAYWERSIAGQPDEQDAWIGECVSELEREAPRAGLWFILLALDAVRSAEILAILAAGPMENVLCHGGADVIDAVEAIARSSPKFRLLLSGCWGRNRMDEEVWRRAGAAVAKGPRFCGDARTLGHAGGGREATGNEIETLLATSVIADLGGSDAALATIGLPMPGCDAADAGSRTPHARH